MLDEKRLKIVARNRGIKAKEGEPVGMLIVESIILLSVKSQTVGGNVHRAAAPECSIDAHTVALKMKRFRRKIGLGRPPSQEPKPAKKPSEPPSSPW